MCVCVSNRRQNPWYSGRNTVTHGYARHPVRRIGLKSQQSGYVRSNTLFYTLFRCTIKKKSSKQLILTPVPFPRKEGVCVYLHEPITYRRLHCEPLKNTERTAGNSGRQNSAPNKQNRRTVCVCVCVCRHARSNAWMWSFPGPNDRRRVENSACLC